MGPLLTAQPAPTVVEGEGAEHHQDTQAEWEAFPREMLLSAGCETVPGQVTKESSLEARGNGMCWVSFGDTGP